MGWFLTCMCPRKSHTYTHTYVCTVCMYVRMYVCMFVRMYVCTYVCMYVCMCKCVVPYIHTYVNAFVCVLPCMCTYIHVHMYVCVYYLLSPDDDAQKVAITTFTMYSNNSRAAAFLRDKIVTTWLPWGATCLLTSSLGRYVPSGVLSVNLLLPKEACGNYYIQ